MRHHMLWILTAALIVIPLALPAPLSAADAVTVLDSTSYWRLLSSWDWPVAKTEKGLILLKTRPGRGVCKCDVTFNHMTRYPADGWASPEFDDSSWARRTFLARWVNGEGDHRAGGGMASARLRQLSVRGKFAVTDPAAVKGLKLSISYRGGVVVRVNGKEIARAHLPAGTIKPGSPAEMYEKSIYLRADGRPQLWYPSNKEGLAAFARRERKLENVAVPAGALRKGVNVLAVEIHQSAYPAEYRKTGVPWGACGLISLRLRADGAGGLVPNVARPAGVQVWNTNVCAHLYDVEYGDPNEPLRPIALAGARNGSYTGRVAVGSDKPMKNFLARASALKGPGGKRIPASAVRVGYGRFDHLRGSRWGGALPYDGIMYGRIRVRRDDAVIDTPPGTVPLTRKGGSAGAVQPVDVTVDVPKDAAPGAYAGKLTITMDGLGKPVTVPVHVEVIDWTLPDPADYTYFLGLIQSPEGVALAYKVPLWSDRHLKLVGRSLELIGQTGGKVLYLPLGAESQYGNERSMVLWVKGGNGKYTYDFGLLEKYLDLAQKKMPKPTFVVCGVWDSCMHCYAPAAMKRKGPKVSVRDARTGKISNVDGPKYDAPESIEFWKPVLRGIRDILARRGLADRMLLGYAADVLPNKKIVENFHKVVPQAAWQSTRHGGRGCEHLAGESTRVPVKYHANVWGGWDNHDPDCMRIYGWKYPARPSLRTWLDRDLFDASPIPQFRTAAEQSLLANRRGLGQIGADFWPVKGHDGRPTHTMVGRFPGTSEGNLGIYAGQLLYPGPNGPVPTLRYVMLRENIQECEARIFLEKLLTAKPCPVPEEVAKKCQAVLDERTRWHRVQLRVSGEARLFWAYSGWEARSAALYRAAAEAAKAVVKAGR